MWKKEDWIIFLIVFLILALFTKNGAASANDQSRMAAIQSIVEFKTFSIDRSGFAYTIDKVRINDHFYSDKTVFSYLIAVPIYFILYNSGITFSEWPHLTYYLITLLTIGLSVSIMLVYFFRFLERYELEIKTRFFYTITLGFGTLLLPYSVVFNNHGLAAALLFLSFYLVLNVKKATHMFFAGLLTGMIVCVDLITGFVFLPLFAYLIFIRSRIAKTSIFFAGACIPILMYLLINFHISGSLIPFNLNLQAWSYPGSQFGVVNIPHALLHPHFNYLFNITVGSKAGFFLYTPILSISLIGLILAITRNILRKEAIIIILGTAGALLSNMLLTGNYGGCAYGFRYMVSVIPLIYYFTPLAFKVENKILRYIYKITFGIFLLASIFFAFVGVINPWMCGNVPLPGSIKELLRNMWHSIIFYRI